MIVCPNTAGIRGASQARMTALPHQWWIQAQVHANRQHKLRPSSYSLCNLQGAPKPKGECKFVSKYLRCNDV